MRASQRNQHFTLIQFVKTIESYGDYNINQWYLVYFTKLKLTECHFASSLSELETGVSEGEADQRRMLGAAMKEGGEEYSQR